jgi:hypothetical protein
MWQIWRIGDRDLVGKKPVGKRHLARPRCKWQDNIKFGLLRNGIDGAWTGSEKMAGSCECDNKPPDSIKCGEFLDYLRTY